MATVEFLSNMNVAEDPVSMAPLESTNGSLTFVVAEVRSMTVNLAGFAEPVRAYVTDVRSANGIAGKVAALATSGDISAAMADCYNEYFKFHLISPFAWNEKNDR